MTMVKVAVVVVVIEKSNIYCGSDDDGVDNILVLIVLIGFWW